MKTVFVILLSSFAALAQVKGPAAAITDVAWMEGRWRCENDWGVSEECWLSPAGGTMSGIYRMSSNSKPVFFEFVTIAETNGSLVFRIKHFDGDMTAWEEKPITIDFPLVSFSKDELVFDGSAYKKRLVIKRLADGSMNMALDSESKSGKKSTAVFPFTRL